MPRPVYILCSESGAEDKITGLLSVFNLIDKLQVNRAEAPVDAPILFQLRISATWMRTEEDADREFDFETRVVFPDGSVGPLHSGNFSFLKDFQRITTRILGQIPTATQSGIMRVQNRVRPTGGGDDDWQTQEYPIVVDVLEVTATPPPTTDTLSRN